ncbi:hypothetical protein Pan241w_11080 [Gimesia alba]|uniref:Uncharacterized protein n=1 Tax=Gimesia alba TaxID=2527973 RepID=A0A517RAZ1_9PLAN|nr:hypothetical protein [Gimesia alba]QDT41049.1 hypothetical protein Pan241w_11080 [Gimesia alba]
MGEHLLPISLIAGLLLVAFVGHKAGYIKLGEAVREYRHARDEAERKFAETVQPESEQKEDLVGKRIVGAIVGAAVCSGIVKLLFWYFG